MSHLTAECKNVNFGMMVVEGLMAQDGTFAISNSQVASAFELRQDNASRDLKAVLGETLNSVKFRVRTADGKLRVVNCLSIIQFQTVMIHLANKGNEKAILLRDSLIGLSFHQMFCDAFGIEFDLDARAKFLADRMSNKLDTRELTDAIKTMGLDKGNDWIYPNVMNAINVGLFGKTAKTIKAELGISTGSLNRDHFGRKAINRISSLQTSAARKILKGADPLEVITQIIDFNEWDIMDYKS